jgi:hypothetical protein
MAESSAPVSEQEPGEDGDSDAFGSLATPRATSERTVLPPREADEPPPKPAAVETKEEKLKQLIPVQHRESFSHSATWWQNNIEIFKHKSSGRYLYLSKEAEDETKVHAYQYTAVGHKFVEITMERALEFATMGEKVGEKKRF